MPSARSARFLIVILAVAAIGALASTPVQVSSTPVCFRCGREIAKARLAAQIIAPQGAAYTFRTVSCLTQHLATVDERDRPAADAIYVTDWPTGQLVRAERAFFVEATLDYRTRERDFFAFRSANEALKFADQRVSTVVDWVVVKRLATVAATN